jgi:hypothetical protein
MNDTLPTQSLFYIATETEQLVFPEPTRIDDLQNHRSVLVELG